MKADATIFDTDDLSEPGYGGQVVATSHLLHYIEVEICKERRTFIRSERDGRLWRDKYGFLYSFSDLVDIVIFNRGEEL